MMKHTAPFPMAFTEMQDWSKYLASYGTHLRYTTKITSPSSFGVE